MDTLTPAVMGPVPKAALRAYRKRIHDIRYPRPIARATIRNFSNPCVYLFMKGKQVLYVGASKRGFVRAFDREHHALEARMAADKVQILSFETLEQALNE